MREIKFRAWMSPDKYMLSHDELMKIPITYHNVFEGNSKYPCMQFTGLLDKNGVEIYEGDIVKGISRDPHKHYIGKIHYDSIYCSFCMHGIDAEYIHHKFPLSLPLGECRFDIEVIGNIYENPELLEA